MGWRRLPRGARPLAWLVWLLFAGIQPVHAATRVHALVIGNNGTFARARAPVGSEQPSLRYADDDAAAFYEFLVAIAPSAELLTVMDAETQARYPELVARARVPSISAVREAVARLRERILERSRAGDRNVVFVFFSGHGTVDYEGRPALALFDAGLSQDFLYREILEQLPADELHLLIDACHAEAVVRPRDAEGERVNVSPDEASAFLVQNTLARYPHVGAIVAATSNATAHEWDALQHGIFTHELLSALRGAADVNRDRLLEYSEVYAFMAAANRQVSDPRARLAVVAKPPDTNRRTALLHLSEFPTERLAWLADIPGARGIIEVEDERGRRIATLHGDAEFVADLLVPAGLKVYVRANGKEAPMSAQSGQVVSFDDLAFAERGSRERGAVADAIRAGLFASAYGRRYYDGIVDQLTGFIPVDFAGGETSAPPAYWSERNPSTWFQRYQLVVGAGLSVGVAEVVPLTHGINLGLRAARGTGLALSLKGTFASDGPIDEWHWGVDAGWLWSVEQGPVRGWMGGVVGAGLLSQSAAGLPSRHSASGNAGPVLGITTELDEHFGTWSEIELLGQVYREDSRTVLSFAPSAWIGASFRM